MKIKNLTAMNPMFVPALDKLIKKDLPVKTCFSLAKMVKEINDNLEIIDKAKLAIVDKYAQKDEDGKIRFQDNGQPLFNSDEDKKKFLEDLKDLAEQEFDISVETKIPLPSDIKMSVDEILAIEHIVELDS